MIYLITGVPGSGKSLYAVSTLLQKLMKETIKREDGTEIKRRLCIDGIPNLLLPHELMAPRAEATFAAVKDGQVKEGDAGHGLWNWYEWTKPGDVLVCDEVQRHWRPRGMGTKPPEEIARLEVHRHHGVDFVLITQNAMLLDQNVRRLVGRHIHVRRIFGGARALIYDWDGCQTDTTRTQGATRSVWSYPKSAYKLYKSSELHTKQQQRIPYFFAFPLVVVAIGAFAGPKAYDAMHHTMTGKAVTHSAQAATTTKPVNGPSAGPPAPAVAPASAAALPSPAASTPDKPAAPELAGCIVIRDRCGCVDTGGHAVKVEPAACREKLPQGEAVQLAGANVSAPMPGQLDDSWNMAQPALPPLTGLRILGSTR